jgi:metallophosphoesterase (TIGR00282 family)
LKNAIERSFDAFGQKATHLFNRFNSLVLARLIGIFRRYSFNLVVFRCSGNRWIFLIMKMLIIGDVVARPGRRAVLNNIAQMREEHDADITIMNAENVAGGFSITPDIADELFGAGIDLMTSGNHIFDKNEVIPYIKRQNRLLRPANYPPGTPGSGLFVGEINGFPFAAVNLLGRVFMAPNVDDPFRAADECVNRIPEDVKIRIVDLHCEASSEKYAMGWFLDGRVSAVVGTHTHVPTADERILDDGTAYVTDLGMTGSYAGVIGMNREDVLNRFTRFPNKRAAHAKGSVWICYIVVDVNESTGKAISITRHKRVVD